VCNESSSDGSTVRRRGRKKKRKDGLLTTGDMARLSNSTLRTVRFYEEADILHPVVRSDGGHRLFSSVELEKLLLVTDMRAAGLSLDEIKTILAIKTTSKTGVEAAQRVGKYLREQIRQMEEKWWCCNVFEMILVGRTNSSTDAIYVKRKARFRLPAGFVV